MLEEIKVQCKSTWGSVPGPCICLCFICNYSDIMYVWLVASTWNLISGSDCASFIYKQLFFCVTLTERDTETSCNSLFWYKVPKEKKQKRNTDVIKQLRCADRCLPDRVHRRRSIVGIQPVLRDVLVSQIGRDVGVANRFVVCSDCWSGCWDPCWTFSLPPSHTQLPVFSHLPFSSSASLLALSYVDFSKLLLLSAEAFNVDLTK